ncbi:ATP-dependent protease [Ectothiorhodospiraceae bacterium BW-2]|nr:ATP-dependent protease [Ectothiorhodospiraceae bacterium BW-2]
MALATLYSRAGLTVDAILVTIEVHLANGLPGLSIVGLPETTVKESRERVKAAIQNCHLKFPERRITINLAPADLPKEGGRFDLPIALGILAAANLIPTASLNGYEFAGELSLSGELRPVKGVLPLVMAAKAAGRKVVVPQDNGTEAALVSGIEGGLATHLAQVVRVLRGEEPWLSFPARGAIARAGSSPVANDEVDMADVLGQHHARRALEIAAAGSHNLLLYGPPGTGKTMLASRLATIMPPMSEAEALQSAAVSSISQSGFQLTQWRRRPFRSPHHTASSVALVGGGNPPRPGEVSLAHNGVLFLDELPEFDRKVLEVLREPLEAGVITIARASHQADFPARLQLVAAMNPCPCGYLGHPSGKCHCTAIQIDRYRSRISGPLLDRIDMQIEVPPVKYEALEAEQPEPMESSETIRQRVVACREWQLARQGRCNSQLMVRELKQVAALDEGCRTLLQRVSERFGLSARAHHRIQKVARTIADLQQVETITTTHLAEAISYRHFDRPVTT